MGIKRRHWALAAAPLALALLATTGCESTPTPGQSRPLRHPRPWPGVRQARRLAKAPAGAVSVDPAVVGDLAAKTKNSPPNTTFWLRPAAQARSGPLRPGHPQEGEQLPRCAGRGADGRKSNQYAFGGTASDVTIRYLTVQGFVAPRDEGVVNHDSADGVGDRARDDPEQLRRRADGRCPPAGSAPVACATTASTA